MKVIESNLESGTSSTQDVVDKLRHWLGTKNPKAMSIGIDDDIIDNRIIDSLQFITFLLYIEELLGRKLRSDEIDEEALRTIRRIRDTFFG